MSPTTQTWLPDWYPDPHDPTRLRWWDGVQWTNHSRSASTPATPGPTNPQYDATSDGTAPTMTVLSRTTRLICGGLFGVVAVLSLIQVLIMTTFFSLRDSYGHGLLVALPFDWYLLLTPYWMPHRDPYLFWGLIPAVILLAGCALAWFAFARRRAHVAQTIIAGALTLENILVWVLLLVSVGTEFRSGPLLDAEVFAVNDAMGVFVAVIIAHLLVTILPLAWLWAVWSGSNTPTWRGGVFLGVAGVYAVWCVATLLINPDQSTFLLTPGPASQPLAWVSIVTTLALLVGLALPVAQRFRPDVTTASTDRADQTAVAPGQ
ncbi:MAG: DUF2510 domain-containing protein [Propionibacteriaceae bacterium]|jgi:hypothetical protein|nr:DUF2510 domain-containing protein [Propionibacteriaceae bacterium]